MSEDQAELRKLVSAGGKRNRDGNQMPVTGISVRAFSVRPTNIFCNLPACRSVGIDSIPLVTETLGGLAEDTIHTLRTLGKAIGQRSCSLDPSLATKHLFARFAIALWRGNASMWLHRQPTLPPALDGLI